MTGRFWPIDDRLRHCGDRTAGDRFPLQRSSEFDTTWKTAGTARHYPPTRDIAPVACDLEPPAIARAVAHDARL